MIPEPFDLSLEDFIKGIGQTRQVVVDFIFAGSFEEFWEENSCYIEPQDCLSKTPILAESDVVENVNYILVEGGVIAVDGDYSVIGCYLWNTLCLSRQWQGRGIGRELVIHRCVSEGRNPVWDADKPAYSPAGLAAHKSAWVIMQ